MEPIYRLVAPQHLGRQVHEFLIQPGRLLIPTAMRLQTRPGQNMGHGRKVDRGNEPLFLHHLLQRFVLFPGQEFEEPGLVGRARTQAARRTRSAASWPSPSLHCVQGEQRSFPLKVSKCTNLP